MLCCREKTDRMIVKVRQTGGLAGVEQELGSIDTGGLDEGDATRLRVCIAELTSLHDEQEPPVGADMFRYEIEICHDGGERRELVFTHEGDPERPLPQPLLDMLNVLGISP